MPTVFGKKVTKPQYSWGQIFILACDFSRGTIFSLHIYLTIDSNLFFQSLPSFFVGFWFLCLFCFGFGFDLLVTECLACAKYRQEQMVKASSNSCLPIRVKRFPERRGPWSGGVGRMGAALGELGDKGGGEQSEQSVSFPGPQRSPRIFCGTEDSKVNTRDCHCLAFL